MTELDDGDDELADASIGEHVERLETIIERLEDGEVSLERAAELRSEGEERLEALETALDLGEGEVIERS